MKTLKRIIILMAILALLTGGQALAAETPTLQIQNVFATEKGTLNAVIHTTVEGNLQATDFTVKLDGQEATATSVGSYYKSELGTTYLFLVDAPRAMKNGSFTMLKDTVMQLIDQMGVYDNAAILTTGGSITNLSLTGGKALLTQSMNSIEKGTTQDTLNASISDAVAYLRSAVDRKPRACLVVLSTGETRDETGMTQAELQKTVADQPITLYTFAFVTDETDNKRLKQANDFGILARQSLGGVDTVVTGKMTAKTLTGVISENEKLFLLLGVETTTAPTATGAGMLSIALKDGRLVLSDETTLTADVLSALAVQDALPTESVQPSERPTDTGAATPTPVPGGWLFTGMDGYLPYLLIGLGVMLVALVITLVVVSKRRKRSFELDNAPDSQLNQGAAAPLGGGKTQILEDDLRTEPVMDQHPLLAKLRVTLTQIGMDAEQKYTAEMSQTLVIGRSSRSARLVIAKDPTISGIHAKLTYDGNALRIEDLKSANGTKINGVKTTVPTVLHSDDVLTFGKTSLRITWQRI